MHVCKPCQIKRGAVYHERACADPIRRERLREQRRRWQEAWRRANPETYHATQARWREELKNDPERYAAFLENQRMTYRLRIERRTGRLPAPARSPLTVPTVPLGPFRDWLLAYQVDTGLDSAVALAEELGIQERRVRYVLAEEAENVSLDVVDRALIEARRTVEVGGRTIFGLEDLYPSKALAA
jgi:hypothetical protein